MPKAKGKPTMQLKKQNRRGAPAAFSDRPIQAMLGDNCNIATARLSSFLVIQGQGFLKVGKPCKKDLSH